MTKFQFPSPSLAWTIPYEIVCLIAVSEGLRLKAYLCPAGVWTIGYGETVGVYEGMEITKAEVDDMFCREIRRYAVAVMQMCAQLPTYNELGALVSLAYNIGLGGPRVKGGLYSSTVLKSHNRGDKASASRAFTFFTNATIKGKKVELPGLVARRAKEAALYLTPVEDEHDETPHVAIPQAVAAETSLASSPIAQGGAALASTGALQLLNDASDKATAAGASISTLQSVAGSLNGVVQAVAQYVGVSPGFLLGAVALVAGISVIVYRHKQRSGGWA